MKENRKPDQLSCFYIAVLLAFVKQNMKENPHILTYHYPNAENISPSSCLLGISQQATEMS